MQYRKPVGAGPSGKTWPKCAAQVEQCTSVRVENHELSIDSPIGAPAMGCVKDGQPVPLSNLSACKNRGVPQQTQAKYPASFGKLS